MSEPEHDSQTGLSLALKERAFQEGFNPVGIASLPGSSRLQLRTAALQRWLQQGFQADMGWMAAERRRDPARLLDGAKSVLAVGLNYYVNVKPAPSSLKIARYGWGRDYHRLVDQRLRRIGRWLSQKRPGCHWRSCVDSAPLLDKAWAEEAGLGWIGKNSNVIHPKRGSWMVIGHLLTTEPLVADEPSNSLCGSCEACIHACPTDAIREPFVVDANRCIAYHTIENKDSKLPETIESSLGAWVAGCDICQDICPWNQHDLPSTSDPQLQPQPWMLDLNKQDVLGWDTATWDQRLRGSALRRIKAWMWRRNAIAAEPERTPNL